MQIRSSARVLAVVILTAVTAQEFDHMHAKVMVVDVDYGSSEISFSIPHTTFSGPGHNRDLCIHPSPDMTATAAYPDQPPVEEGYQHRGVTPLIVTHAVEARVPQQCVVHQVDALAVCAKLDGCKAMTCLPLDNFASLDPAQHKTDQGPLIGVKTSTLQMAEAAVTGNYAQLEAALMDKSDVDAVDYVTGRTALMEAAKRGDLRQVELLINWGASAEMVDHEGLKALDHSLQVKAVRDRHDYLEIEELLRERSFQEKLAASRLTSAQITDSPEHDHIAIRMMTTSPKSPRASTANRFMREGVYGPLCLARGHTAVNMAQSEKCSAHPTSPKPQCLNLMMHAHDLGDVIDLPQVPAKTAQRLDTGLRRGDTLLAVPADGRKDGALWFQTWDRNSDDVVGLAPGKAGFDVTYMLVFVR